MDQYRVLVFDYGHVNASHVITARDDEDAIEEAKKFLAGNDIEVWQDRRFMVRLRPQSSS